MNREHYACISYIKLCHAGNLRVVLFKKFLNYNFLPKALFLMHHMSRRGCIASLLCHCQLHRTVLSWVIGPLIFFIIPSIVLQRSYCCGVFLLTSGESLSSFSSFAPSTSGQTRSLLATSLLTARQVVCLFSQTWAKVATLDSLILFIARGIRKVSRWDISLCVCCRWPWSIVSCRNSSMHASSQIEAGPRIAEKSYMTDDVWSARTDHTVLGDLCTKDRWHKLFPWIQPRSTEIQLRDTQFSKMKIKQTWAGSADTYCELTHGTTDTLWKSNLHCSYLIRNYSYRFSTRYMIMSKK